MRKEYLPSSPPLIGEDEIAEVLDTLRSDWITTGPKVKRFEQDPSTPLRLRSVASGQGSQSSSARRPRWISGRGASTRLKIRTRPAPC